MYVAAQEEADAISKVIQSMALFRYGVGRASDRFERPYTSYIALAAGGSNALVAAMMAPEVGSGDWVIIPVHT
jgi:hypothetical protein